ncbi:P-loop NTPase [Sedimentitalea sp. XS_ASV28]
MGASGKPASSDRRTIIPVRAHGVTMMFIGLMVDDSRAVVWRGPMLMALFSSCWVGQTGAHRRRDGVSEPVQQYRRMPVSMGPVRSVFGCYYNVWRR